MKATPLTIPDVILFEPQVYNDKRGFFFESFNQQIFEKATGLSPVFVQDNHSKSSKGVLRGLHYQSSPKAQGKLVRVVWGEIFDVAVDIRKSSPTFGQWIGEVLTSEEKNQLWIPKGFAHGLLCLSETAEVLYKTNEYYAPDYERCIAYDDPKIGIEWPTDYKLLISDKDQQGMMFKDSETFG